MKIEKKTWVQIHNWGSAFFLPLAFIFILTGMLYLLGVRSTMKEQRIDFQMERALLQDSGALTAAVKEKLEANRIAMPAGEVRRMRDGYVWGEMSGTSVALMPDQETGGFQLTVSTARLYDRLLMVHKGKAGLLFKIFSILFSFALLLSYFSGLIMVWKNASSRKNSLLAVAIGLFVTVVLLVLNL
jgi:hypothetical protein